MVRKPTKFVKSHVDADTAALFQTYVVSETGEVNINSAIKALVKLNYSKLAEQAREEIAEYEAEEAEEQAKSKKKSA